MRDESEVNMPDATMDKPNSLNNKTFFWAWLIIGILVNFQHDEAKFMSGQGIGFNMIGIAIYLFIPTINLFVRSLCMFILLPITNFIPNISLVTTIRLYKILKTLITILLLILFYGINALIWQ